MESNSTSTPSSLPNSEHLSLHLNNLQLLAAVDCALAVTTLMFNCRQLVLTIDNLPNDSEKSDSSEEDSSNKHFLIVSLLSVSLTLAQLLLACLMMISLSQINHRKHRAQIVSGIWVGWNGILIIILAVYVLILIYHTCLFLSRGLNMACPCLTSTDTQKSDENRCFDNNYKSF